MFSLNSSHLYDQTSFYKAFLCDLERAQSRVIIESPFITSRRMAIFFPTLLKLRKRGIRVIINTKPPDEHEVSFKMQVIHAISAMQDTGIIVLFTVGHHRKLAIIDDKILWEGSLNILSQNDSCEYMRRIHSSNAVKGMIQFTGVEKWR